MSVWLFVFAIAGVAGDPNTKSIGKLEIVGACLFILGYASTWAPGIWIFVGESFATRTRAKQAALATLANWIWNFCIGFFTKSIVDNIHFSYGFVFAGCNVANCLIAYFFVYESADLTLEAVDLMYNDPNCKPWHSRAWAPPGFETRDDLVKAKESGNEITFPPVDPGADPMPGDKKVEDKA